MKLGVLSDVHGNRLALDAVLADGASVGVERWWALGDLVLSGSRPVEVLETLRALPDIAFVGGNTDRYVVTGAQPPAHPTIDDVVDDRDLIRRYSEVAASIGWAKGALVQAGLLDWLGELPTEQRLTLPDGTRVLGIHASPASDDGAGISPLIDDTALAGLLGDCDADVVVGGHTHRATDRAVGAVRALNPGSVGLPFDESGKAGWMAIDADADGVWVDHRRVPFDVEAVVADVHQRRHPAAPFIEAVLRGTHQFTGGARR